MRSQRAVQRGRAIPDVHRYLRTAQRGPCRAPECYAGGGGGITAASQSGHQKTTLSAGWLPLLLGTGLGSGSFTALTASWAPT